MIPQAYEKNIFKQISLNIEINKLVTNEQNSTALQCTGTRVWLSKM